MAVMEQKVNFFTILPNHKLGQFLSKWQIIIIKDKMTLNCKSLQNIQIFLAIFQYAALVNYESCQPDMQKWKRFV